MISRMLFLLLAMPAINFSSAKEGTVFKESCQFITFVYQYFLEEGADYKTIVNPTQSTLQKFQEFIRLRPKCANFTRVEFYDFQRAKETEHLVAEITFIIFAKDEIMDISERETAPNLCEQQVNIILPVAQDELRPLIPRNISGKIDLAESVGSDTESCCKRLYKQPSEDRACCKPGFVEFGENCTCVAGTFLNLNMTTCEPCPKDTYQPDQASTRCKPCPNGTTTYTTTGAKNVSTCLKGGGSFSDEKELFDELEMLASLAPYPHQNIVNLIGGTISNDGPLFVAVEYCANGNLLKYLQRNQTRSDPKPEYVNIFPKAPKPSIQYYWKLNKAIEICNGMAHLAKHKIIHRDVAARNVLLDEKWMAKISDFGMARDIYVQQIYRKDTEGFLPVRWMAIESLESFIYTTQSDVWSFGILLWEIITDGRVPYNNILDHTQLLNYIKSGRIMKRPKSCPKDYYHIMQKCWATTPSNRPLFENLIREIEILYDQEMRKDEALPQRIFRRFSSKRKSRKSEEDKEGNSSRGSGRRKLRLQKSSSNTSASKIDKIEEELCSGNGSRNSIKMQVLETPDREETFTKERVNKGYHNTGSVTADDPESQRNNKLGMSAKEERGEGTSENVSHESLLKSSKNRKASCSEKKTGETSKDATKNDTPLGSKPKNATESLTSETIPERRPLDTMSDLRPSIKGEERTEGLTNIDVFPTRNQDIEDVTSVEPVPEASLEFISHRRPDVSEINDTRLSEPDENTDSVVLGTNLATALSSRRPDIRWDERSDSDSLTSLSLRGDEETGLQAPIASSESDSGLSGIDNWSNQLKELDTSSGC